jgi:hypothetical protein
LSNQTKAIANRFPNSHFKTSGFKLSSKPEFFHRDWTMAKRKINKSHEIREYIKGNPTTSTKDVVAALKKRGVDVAATMVSNVKSKAGLTRKRRGRPPAKKSSSEIGIDALIDAKRLVAKTGSAQKAIELIRALEKLDSIVG